MRRILVLIGFLGVSLALARPAQAVLTCGNLTVTHVWVYASSGALVATVKFTDELGVVQQKGWPLCKLEGASGVVSEAMCQEYRTALWVAKTTGKTVDIAFLDAIGYVSCKDVPWDLTKISTNLQYMRVNP